VNHGLQLTGFGRREPLWPWVLVAICLICLMMKLALLFAGDASSEAWIHFWGFSPERVMAQLSQPFHSWFHPELIGLLTALLTHADWLHLLGNLAYLWVFGIAVERAVGHWRFALLFFLLGGLANLYAAWQLADSSSVVIGASGGVSAIIGVYLGLFPQRRMGLWVPLGLYLQFARVPALLVIGSWFTLQLLYSLFGPMSDAIAWWSHVAGFVAGVVTALVLRLFTHQINYPRGEY
jgi:membrane associated rhomboid family serine protease